MDLQEFVKRFEPWHPKWTRALWEKEVDSGECSLGYWEWAYVQDCWTSPVGA